MERDRFETVSEKITAQASIGEGDGENADESPTDDLHSADEKLSKSYEKAAENKPEAAIEQWGDSLDYAARVADSTGPNCFGPSKRPSMKG